MADDVRVTNWPQQGSHEAVALELWRGLRNAGQSVDEALLLYIKCRDATYGTKPTS